VPDTRIGHTFGHEFVGIVEEVGSAVRTLKPGDRVLVPFNLFCGSCFFCQRELYGNCHNTNPEATAVGAIYGYSHTPAATTAARPSTCACRWPTSARTRSRTTSTTTTPCC
jgi:threonine dehydrogenase-like Zn-dependent dehydrogenase